MLLVAPTGSGKTVMFSYITSEAAKRGGVVWILAHRVELVDQISRTLAEFGVAHSFVAAGYDYDPRAAVYVCSVFTVAKRLGKVRAPSLIVVDEAHHAIGATTWGKVLTGYPGSRVLGVTATPIRLSGEGLGECFARMVVGPTVADLIRLGALCDYTAFAPPLIRTDGLRTRAGEFVAKELRAAADNSRVTGDAVLHYQRLAMGRRAVAFCVSVAHAEHVAQEFNAAGIRAQSVDGSLDRDLRRAIIRSYVAGEIEVLTSCDLVSEGFDVPAVEVAISLRPTQSEGLWLQQCGRVLRPSPGKPGALIVDHAGNIERHGLPDDERVWSLAGRDAKEKDAAAIGVRVCPKCFRAVRAGVTVCPCGAAFPVQPREVEVAEGDLEEVDKEALRRARRREERSCRTLEDYQALAAARGYKPGWAKHRYEAAQAVRARYAPPPIEVYEEAFGG